MGSSLWLRDASLQERWTFTPLVKDTLFHSQKIKGCHQHLKYEYAVEVWLLKASKQFKAVQRRVQQEQSLIWGFHGNLFSYLLASVYLAFQILLRVLRPQITRLVSEKCPLSPPSPPPLCMSVLQTLIECSRPTALRQLGSMFK